MERSARASDAAARRRENARKRSEYQNGVQLRHQERTARKEYVDSRKNTAKMMDSQAKKRLQSYIIILQSDASFNCFNFFDKLKNYNDYSTPLGLLQKIKILRWKLVFVKIVNFLQFKTFANKLKISTEKDLSKINSIILAAQKKFDSEKTEHNNKVDEFEKSFLNGDREAIAEVFETLAQDLIIDKIIQDLLEDEQFKNAGDYIDVAFDRNLKTLIIKTTLPSQNYISRDVEYKYIATRDEITSKAMKDKDFNKLYDSILSQIVLLYAKLAFNVISDNILSCVVINGYVRGIDPSTGKKLNNCVVSASILREKFEEIDFEHIDPIQCLKSFKARVASEFINISAVNPILEFDKNDNRFVVAENVIDNFENSTNLATMDWEKFEYLVRDLFGKMFSEHGGEVKITQASRDKGVDAIVFDPDPIRGGKFVIQCKRYNNVVGVSDVRDLWGTVMHEGASKGILVTTSHFGVDSIEWSKDKPITLINGQNLLSLFQKYGYDFKIELQK